MPTLRAAMVAAQSGTPGRWWGGGLGGGQALRPGSREAWQAQYPPCPSTGPVFVELPIDVLYPYFIVQKEMVPAKPPKGLVARMVTW